MKKLITLMLSCVIAACFSVAAFAAEVLDMGYYAILKDKFSPTDSLIMNHLVKYANQNPNYYPSITYTQHIRTSLMNIRQVATISALASTLPQWPTRLKNPVMAGRKSPLMI